MAQINPEIIESLIQKEPDETASGYSVFLYWALLPPAERPNSQALKKLSEIFGLSEGTIRQYRSAYNWDERINTLDAYIFKVQIQTRNELFEKNNEKIANEMREFQEIGMNNARLAMETAKNLLETFAMSNKPIQTDFVKAVMPDGSTKAVPTTTTIEMSARVSDIAPLMRVAGDLPLRLMGLPTETVRYQTLVTDKPLSEKTYDELDEEAARLQREIDALTKNDPIN